MTSAKQAHSGFWGYAIALLLSVIFGAAFGWAVRASAAGMFHVTGNKPETPLMRLYLCGYLCAAFLLPFLGLFVGAWATDPIFTLLR